MSAARKAAAEALAQAEACECYNDCDKPYSCLGRTIDALRALLAETGATPDVAEEVSAVRHRIDNGRRCRDCGEAIGITAYADDLLDKFAQAPAPPAASDEVREAAERYRVASAAARDCRRAHATYRYETICDEKDERDIAAIALAEKLVAALSRPAPCPACGRTGKGCACTIEERDAALSRPAAKGGHE